jgi:8-oxo-dGTP pyrophosphatase MutT (NUDIX family)
VITDGRAVILGHSTGNAHSDIPKGLVEPGESALAACLREIEEETGCRAPAAALEDLGLQAYTAKKDLHLFRWCVATLPEREHLVCRSKFFDERTQCERPELDRFLHVPFDEVGRYARPALAALVLLARP